MSIGLIFIFYVSCLLFPNNGDGPVRKINISLLRKVHFEASNGNATLKKSPLSNENVITDFLFATLLFFLVTRGLKILRILAIAQSQCDNAI